MSSRACTGTSSPTRSTTEKTQDPLMPAHPDAPPVDVPTAWSWRLAPALVVCLAAPAFFVVRLPWLGWSLLAVGLALAWLLERRDAAPRPDPAATPGRSGAAGIRVPSLVRDLSLIAAGLL